MTLFMLGLYYLLMFVVLNYHMNQRYIPTLSINSSVKNLFISRSDNDVCSVVAHVEPRRMCMVLYKH